MPTFGLYRTWYPHFMTSFTINDITCTVFFPSHALYMTTHLLSMMSHSLYVLHHTVTLSMVSHTIGLCYIHLIWHQAQCYDHKTIVCLPSHYAWYYTQCIFDIKHNVPIFFKRSECLSSQSLYLWHHMQYIWHHIHSLWLQTIEVVTLHPLHSCHHTPNIWHNTYGNTNVISAICHTVSNTTSTVTVSSNRGYQLYHTFSLYDITNYTCDIIYSMHAIRTTL